jgi:Putative restriction endonuclease
MLLKKQGVTSVLRHQFIVVGLCSQIDIALKDEPCHVYVAPFDVRLPHDQGVKIPAYERAGVREVWLVHPGDRTVAIYELNAGRYGHPSVRELEGRIPINAVPGVIIDWDEVLAKVI